MRSVLCPEYGAILGYFDLNFPLEYLEIFDCTSGRLAWFINLFVTQTFSTRWLLPADFLCFSTPSGTHPTIKNPYLKHTNGQYFSFPTKASGSTKFIDNDLTGSHCSTATRIYDNQS